MSKWFEIIGIDETADQLWVAGSLVIAAIGTVIALAH